jgi:N-acetylglucosaminyl-diphospho-decaprenol L-rhamnosyltransferase
MPDVCVTIVLYNSRDHLPACLAALREDVDAGRAEIVAVDNASPDDSVVVVEREMADATIIRSAENLGFAGGCNLAWDRVDARYWMLLNPDVVLDPGTLGKLVRWMDAHADVGMASPWLGAYPGRAFPSIRLTLLELVRVHRLLPAKTREALLQGPYVRSGADAAPEPDWLPATAVIVRAEVVEAVGLLDEDFFLYGEDLEWCWRIRRAGWRVAVCPEGGGEHHASASSRRTWDEPLVQERIAAGTLRAVASTRGRGYARAYALANALALAVESWHVGRTRESRAQASNVRRAWWKALRAL